MPSTRIVRTSLAAAAVAVGLFASAPAQAGWGVRIGVRAAVVVPPLVVSVGNVGPVVPYYAPYPARRYVNPYYAPVQVPYPASVVAPGYVPYISAYPTVAPVVVAPRVSYVRVWVPGPRGHWELRRAARLPRWRR
jgi:hypothetical protein